MGDLDQAVSKSDRYRHRIQKSRSWNRLPLRPCRRLRMWSDHMPPRPLINGKKLGMNQRIGM
jgi:hypothetical protein